MLGRVVLVSLRKVRWSPWPWLESMRTTLSPRVAARSARLRLVVVLWVGVNPSVR